MPELTERDLDPDPIKQFQQWYRGALELPVAAPDAMTLATTSREGVPSARMVLLKGVDERGFVFYTNYESQKGRELAENPAAALVFYWPELSRQVRVVGRASTLSRQESEQYFHRRPRGSQIAAWVSPQSTVIPNRAVLEERFRQLEVAYQGREIPLPPHWGGYRVFPEIVEFWQGRPNRLHDRFRYTRLADNTWQIERLAP